MTNGHTEKTVVTRCEVNQLLVFSWRVNAEVEETQLQNLMRLGDETIQQTVDLSRHEVRKIRRHENSAVRTISAVEDHTRARCIHTNYLYAYLFHSPSRYSAVNPVIH